MLIHVATIDCASSSYSVEVRSPEFYNVLRVFCYDKQIKIKLNECLHHNLNKVNECLHQNPNKSNENPQYFDSYA